MNNDLIIISTIIGLTIIVCTGFICYSLRKFKEFDISILDHKDSLNLNLDEIHDIKEMLNLFIEDCFSDYLANNPEIATSEYITDELEVEIRKSLSDRVTAVMTESMYKKLTLYYNRNAIPNVIAEKIYFKVTAFVIEKNQSN